MQNQNAILIKNAEKILQTKIRLWVARSINKLSYIQSVKGFEEFLKDSRFAAKEILATPTSTNESLEALEKLEKTYIKLIDFASLLVLALRYCEKNNVKFTAVTDNLKNTIEDDFGKETPTIFTSSYQPKFLYIFYYSEIDEIKKFILGPSSLYPEVSLSVDPIPRLPAELFTSNIAVKGPELFSPTTGGDLGVIGIKAEFSYFVSTSRNISGVSNLDPYRNLSYKITGDISDLKKIKSDQILKNKTFFITVEQPNPFVESSYGDSFSGATTTYLCYYDAQFSLDLTHLRDFLVKLKDGTTIIAAPIFTTIAEQPLILDSGEVLKSKDPKKPPEVPEDNIVAHAFFERFYIQNIRFEDDYYRILLRIHDLGKLKQPKPLPKPATPLGNGEHYLPDFTTRTDKNYFKNNRKEIKAVEKKTGKHPITPLIYNFSTIAENYNQVPFSLEEFQMMSSRLDVALYFTLQTYL